MTMEVTGWDMIKSGVASNPVQYGTYRMYAKYESAGSTMHSKAESHVN